MKSGPSASRFSQLIARDISVKVLDIGANPIDGSPPYQPMLQAGEASVVGFEPNPSALAKLEELKGPKDVYLPHAVGDGERHTLHICAAPGMTSLLTPNTDVLNLMHGFPMWGQVVATEEVQTVRLADVEAAQNTDLFKMDIQGAELMVLRNAGTHLDDMTVLHLEVEFMQLYKDQPLFSDVELFLRGQGFAFHRFYPIVSRIIRPLGIDGDAYAGLSQQVWADAIFIRDFSKLHTISNRKLLNMAAILHDCYQSIDIVMHILTIYDQRNGSALAHAYLSGIRGDGLASKPAKVA